jgi:hypothetical protein
MASESAPLEARAHGPACLWGRRSGEVAELVEAADHAHVAADTALGLRQIRADAQRSSDLHAFVTGN